MPFFFMLRNIELWKRVVLDQLLLDAVQSCDLGSVAAMTSLRSRWSTDEISVAANLLDARRRATGKLQNAEIIVADSVGVQQATSTKIATHKAIRFKEHKTILDLCCGIGADLHALPQHTSGVELDPLRCWMAQRNTRKDVRCADATTFALPSNCVVHIDPARRNAAGKRLQLEEMLPPFSAVTKIAAQSSGGCIKLSPAIDAEDVASIDQPYEIEYIEENGRMVQAAMWFGSLAKHQGLVTATSLTLGETMTASPQFPPCIPSIGGWLLEPNVALERAGLHGTLAAQIHAHEPAPNLGLLSADELPSSPWCTAFEVLETTPLRITKVSAVLRRLGCTQVEVKTRGKTVDPNQWQKQLNRKSQGPLLTIFALRLGTTRLAVITRRYFRVRPRV